MIFSADALSSVPFSAVSDSADVATNPVKVIRLVALYLTALRLAAVNASTVRLRCTYLPTTQIVAAVPDSIDLVCRYDPTIELEASLDAP